MANWTCHAARNLPINTDREWDGGAAHSSLMDHADIGGDNPRPSEARRGYLLVDDENPENRTAYSLPFAMWIDGTLTALASGLRAAASRLPQKEDVSDEQRQKARAVLDAYFARLDDSEDEDRVSQELNQRVYQFPMRIEVDARQRSPKEMAELMELARERAQDPAVFESSPPYFWRAVVSNTNVDSYGTHQAESSLRNYAQDLTEGRAFLASHDWYSLQMGHSLRGQFTKKRGEQPSRTAGDFYTIPDMNLNGINTSDFIRGIQAGIIRDVSKGFYGGRWVCDLCGNDYRRYGSGEDRCPHFLLEEYEVEGRGLVPCTVTVEDAHISEVSAVYDGSVPGAAIEKATFAIEAGEVPPEKARSLARRYRAALPVPGTLYPVGGDVARLRDAFPTATFLPPPSLDRSQSHSARSASGRGPEEKRMANQPNAIPEPPADPGVLQAFHRGIHEALRDVGCSLDGKEAASLIRGLAAELTELRPLRDKAAELEARVAVLEPQAKDGAAYRTAMVEETWQQFVASGLAEGEDEAATRAEWQQTELSLLLKQQSRYRKLADARFPSGRVTGDGEPDPDEQHSQRGFVTPAPPPGAFRA